VIECLQKIRELSMDLVHSVMVWRFSILHLSLVPFLMTNPEYISPYFKCVNQQLSIGRKASYKVNFPLPSL